jgi:hypothetical protein
MIGKPAPASKAKVQKPSPWHPADYEASDIAAFKALRDGLADADQQQRVLTWLIQQCCETYGLSFRTGADGERETSFSEGKRFVGLQIVKLLNMRVKDAG